MGIAGLRVVGPGRCRDTNTVREFLYKNFVPFHVVRYRQRKRASTCLRGSARRERHRSSSAATATFSSILPCRSWPARQASGGTARRRMSISRSSVPGRPASPRPCMPRPKDLSTLLLDKLGPGGQAGGSSRIENFIGFPAGLTGAELATRGVLQMLKFGARLVAPVAVQKLTAAPLRGDLHTLQAGLRCRTFAAGSCCSAVGVHWRRLEAEGADRFAGAGIYYACTTVEADLYDRATSPSSAAATRRDRPPCSWPSAVRRARCICSSGARWVPACRHTCRSASGQPPTWWFMNRPRSRRFTAIARSKRFP